MEKTFREVAKEFLSELAIESGKASRYGHSNIIKHVIECGCPLLNDNGEEEKMIISKVFVMEYEDEVSISICSQDYYSRHIDKYDDEELRLVIRSICAGLGITDLWMAKLSE